MLHSGSLLVVCGGQPRCLRLGVWRPSPSAALAYGRTLHRRVAGPLCLRRGSTADRSLGLALRAGSASPCGSEASAAGLWPSVEPSRWKCGCASVLHAASFHLWREGLLTRLARLTLAHRSAGSSDDPRGPHASASRACVPPADLHRLASDKSAAARARLPPRDARNQPANN